MKKILTVISLSFLLFSCTDLFHKKDDGVMASEEFAQGSEDIPLLVGMEKISGDSLGFDSNSGSIISSSYEVKADFKKVRNFYLETLPQMGWKLVQNGEKSAVFKRDKEKLEIEFIQNGKMKRVNFFISSAI